MWVSQFYKPPTKATALAPVWGPSRIMSRGPEPALQLRWSPGTSLWSWIGMVTPACTTLICPWSAGHTASTKSKLLPRQGGQPHFHSLYSSPNVREGSGLPHLQVLLGAIKQLQPANEIQVSAVYSLSLSITQFPLNLSLTPICD